MFHIMQDQTKKICKGVDWVILFLNMKHGMFNKAFVKFYHAKFYITIVDFLNFRRCFTY